MSKGIGRIVADANILGGKPVIKGTRIPVSLILGLMAEGMTGEKIVREYPQLTTKDVRAAAAVSSKSISRIRRVAGRHGITHLRVFGSRAAGRAQVGSDLDLLVDVAPGRDLLDLVEFKLDLEDLLGCAVDVVTPKGLSPYLREAIMRQARPL